MKEVRYLSRKKGRKEKKINQKWKREKKENRKEKQILWNKQVSEPCTKLLKRVKRKENNSN